MKKMLRKTIISLLVAFMFLILATLTVHAEVLDQSQTMQTDKYYLSRWFSYAQSFKPEKPILARVELYLRHSDATNNIDVNIRSDLYGSNLASASVHPSTIPKNTWTWVNFDFEDITVTNGNTYYIVATQISGGDLDLVGWGCAKTNIYFGGVGWEQEIWTDPPGSWAMLDNVDFCFKTYGGTGRSRNVNNFVENNELTQESNLLKIKAINIPLFLQRFFQCFPFFEKILNLLYF